MLTQDTLRDAVDALCGADPVLAGVVNTHGMPPLWEREEGFGTLLLLILEQQVSLASARAAFDRVAARLGGEPTAEGLLSLDDDELRADGFSRQKTRYARALAGSLVDGALDLPGLRRLDDDGVRAALTALPGIGPWTADVYLVMVLRRPDAFPAGDLALQAAAQELLGLPSRPTSTELVTLAEPWRPHRATAARILWTHYLAVRGRPTS